MKTITLVAVIAIWLLSFGGGSVGGPMAVMLILFLTMLAVGIHEARLNKRGAPGWIVNIIASVIGGFVAAIVIGMAMETILSHLSLGVSLASSGHPLLYILSAGMVILTVLGSWIALQIVNRFR